MSKQLEKHHKESVLNVSKRCIWQSWDDRKCTHQSTKGSLCDKHYYYEKKKGSWSFFAHKVFKISRLKRKYNTLKSINDDFTGFNTTRPQLDISTHQSPTLPVKKSVPLKPIISLKPTVPLKPTSFQEKNFFVISTLSLLSSSSNRKIDLWFYFTPTFFFFTNFNRKSWWKNYKCSKWKNNVLSKII